MTRLTRLTLSMATLISGLAAPVMAGPIADRATEIETALEAGDQTAAWAGVAALSEEAWNAAPAIGFTTVAMVSEPSVAYGVYNPRKDNNFGVGAPIIIYVEPWGYGYGAAGEGLHAIDFAVDLEVLTEAGEPLGSLADIAKFGIVSRNKLREFNATVTLNLDGISAGKYLLKVTMRDKNSTKSGTFDLPIEIVQ